MKKVLIGSLLATATLALVGTEYSHDPMGRIPINPDLAKTLADEAVKKLPELVKKGLQPRPEIEKETGGWENTELNKIGEQERPEIQKETAEWQKGRQNLKSVGEVKRPEIQKETASWQGMTLRKSGGQSKTEAPKTAPAAPGPDPKENPTNKKKPETKKAAINLKKTEEVKTEAQKIQLKKTVVQPKAVTETGPSWLNPNLKRAGTSARPEIQKEIASWQNTKLRPTVKLEEEIPAEDTKDSTVVTIIKKIKTTANGVVTTVKKITQKFKRSKKTAPETEAQ